VIMLWVVGRIVVPVGYRCMAATSTTAAIAAIAAVLLALLLLTAPTVLHPVVSIYVSTCSRR
jgi:hypothetical protein